MEIVKFLDKVLQDLFNCKCRKQDNNGLEDSKQIHTRLGWVIRDLSPRLKKKNLGFPLVKNQSVEQHFKT